MQRTSIGRLAAATALGLMVATPVRADVAATGTFGIDVSVSFPTGTFDGAITSFDPGPFDVGGTQVDLATDVGSMTIPSGNLTQIDLAALAVTFDFAATDDDLTVHDLDFTGAGVAVCDNLITCSQGQGTFVADVTSLTDPDGLLPGGFVYTFDGTVFVDPGPFDAAGVFGINAFPATAVPAGVPVMATSDPTTFFDSRKNTLRDFLVDLTFAEVTNPGTVSFLGKSAVPGTLPTSIAVHPDLSVVVDVVTGGGLAFTPPVDVCVHYDDVDMDGVVDGTTVDVETLRLLHANAVGDNFQDVTTTVGGGTVCGQVGTLSPFVVAVGPPPTTTTSSSTTSTSTSVTSTSVATTSSTDTTTIATTSTSTTTIATSSTSTTTIATTSTSTTTITTTSTVTSTTTTTLPTLDCETALECLDLAQLVTICPGEEIPKKMSKVYAKKLAKARRLLDKIGRTSKVKKGDRLLAKTMKNVEKVGIKAEKLAAKPRNPLSPTCLDHVLSLLQPIADALEARDLGVPFPTGGTGNCRQGRSMFARIGEITFDATRGDGYVFTEVFGASVYIQGCQDSSGPDGECEKLLVMSFPYTGPDQTTVSCGFNALLEFFDSSDPASGVYQDVYSSATQCSITVEGTPNGQLVGSFTATMQPSTFPPADPVELTGGCFSSRPL